MDSIRDCFVTGKWDAAEDAETLLKEDGGWKRTDILLTLSGWVMHVCLSKLNIIGSDNGLWPGRRQSEPMLEYCQFEL